MSRAQASLFPLVLPEGLTYRTDFVGRDEERALLEHIRELPLREAQYRQYTARRRTANFGFSYDFQHHKANVRAALGTARQSGTAPREPR